MSATEPAEHPRTEAPERPPSTWFSTSLRALAHFIAGGVFAFPLAGGGAVLSAAFGGLFGAAIAPRIARTPLRLPAIALMGALTFALAVGARWFAVDTLWLAPSLGPAAALRLGDSLSFFMGVSAVSLTLRSFSLRRSGFAALEVGAIGLAFAQLVVAHRHGAINRPFELADSIIAAGGDPTHFFLGVGAVGTAVVVLLLLGETHPGRALLHLGAVALLLFLFLGVGGAMKLPEPPPGGMGLGLRPEDGEGEGDPQEAEGQPQDGQGSESQEPQNDDELEFRDDLDTSSDRVPVAVVLFHDDYHAPTGVYYLRQGAFSQYNGQRLVTAVDAASDDDVARDFPVRRTDVAGAPDLNAFRASVDTTVALLADHTRPFGLESPVTFTPARNPDPNRFRRVYRVTSAVLTADFASMVDRDAGNADWSPEDWAHYTRAPDDPRYADLANRIVADELPEHLRESPAARIAAITSWLGRRGTYSLQSRHASAEDPTADFLFGDITGYCVHFAHAATYLFRASGLPARVATGYAIEESNRAGGSALLVAGDASHAWPEVYIDGIGWVIADVSPATVISPPGPPPDADLQRLLGELARGLENVPPEEDDPLPAFVAAARGAAWWLLLVSLPLAVLAFFLLFGVKIWRRLAPAFAPPAARPRVVYRASLDRLSDLAIRRRRGESREAFARRVREVAPTFGPLTAGHVGAAFGSRRPPTELERQAAQIQRELEQRFPWWRRALGWLTPWSWMFSR